MTASRRGRSGLIRSLTLALALVLTSPAAADPIASWRPFIDEASARFGVPVTWVERVMRAESAGRTRLGGRPITSRAGAMGLMQLMPLTWAEMRSAHRLGNDPHDPRDNILAGTAYLRAMHDRFGYPGLFAAYNAGPARYARHLTTGRALPGETRAYVAAVTRDDVSDRLSPASNAPTPLFVLLRPVTPPVPDAAAPAVASGLFFPLSGR